MATANACELTRIQKSAFIILSVPYVEAYLCAYEESATTQEVVFDALVGRAPISGKLPVTIPG